ncbi:MAG TPA: hypothetical protein VNQ76_02815, partial [Planctomicrobium sp.]|nr:hypothetical protein [Planctomicrobium sp.]
MSNTLSMARTVPASQEISRSEPTTLISSKLQPWHWERMAIVYVRQSTPRQVQENRESTAR